MTDSLSPERMFHLLPSIYDAVGFSDYSEAAIEKYIDFLFQINWVGRHALELGCGTGAAAAQLCEYQRMNVTAVDNSPEMLAVAEKRVAEKRYGINFVQDDMRAYRSTDKLFDLVYSINTINYIPSVRQLGLVFQNANASLKLNKIFMFDLWTVKGMATQLGDSDQILHDDTSIYLAQRNRFSYEHYRLHQWYTFFRNIDGDWLRGQEEHVQRGYPSNAISSILNRNGFEVQHILDLGLNPYNVDNDKDGRMIVVAEKVEDI